MVDKAGFSDSLIDTEKLGLGNYMADRKLAGVFLTVGEEKREIRKNPAASTKELLKKNFSLSKGLSSAWDASPHQPIIDH